MIAALWAWFCGAVSTLANAFVQGLATGISMKAAAMFA